MGRFGGAGMKIYLIGFMGCGKTYWGGILSRKLNLPFFDLDEQIASNEGKSINVLFDEKGEEHFRLLEKDALHIITESHESFVMACGGGAPCYLNNIEYMNKSGTTVWINTPFETLLKRLVKDKSNRPLIKELSEEQIRGLIFKKIADRRIYYEQADIKLDDEEINIENLVEKVFHA